MLPAAPKRISHLVQTLNDAATSLEEQEEEEAATREDDEPLGSVRGVLLPRGATGVAGVSWDETAQRYLVRTDGPAQRFRTLAEAKKEASIRLTRAAQRNVEPKDGERALRMGGFSVLVDRGVSSWLAAVGKWGVRRRSDGLLDVRRERISADHPDSSYLTAPDYIVATGPSEKVEFINGNRLDLRVANLRVVPR
jgi:hypothetical protein